MMMKRLACAFGTMVLLSCGDTPSSGTTQPEVLSGGERFGWDQPASDAAELVSFANAIYVDGARSDAADVSCATVAADLRFPCTCRLPALTPGTHTLQIAAFVTDGGNVRESDRSQPVTVVAR